ncbi:MAG: acyl-CoA desaturase [Maricaulaceae bacterium]
MMKAVERVSAANASAQIGTVKLDLKKTFWIGMMIIGSLLAPFYFSWPAFFLFLISTYITLLLGHSVGMHRMMIHRSFKAPKPLARLLIFMGVLVGMGGPSQIIRVHDTGDWAQRLPACHAYFSHTHDYIKDVMWQLFCTFKFETPPHLEIEPELRDDPYIRLFDDTWWIVQLLLAGALFMIGDLGWVLWGCCLRVFISIWGHWSVTYVCHNPGPARPGPLARQRCRCASL